jgi:hypothetical protein
MTNNEKKSQAVTPSEEILDVTKKDLGVTKSYQPAAWAQVLLDNLNRNATKDDNQDI